MSKETLEKKVNLLLEEKIQIKAKFEQDNREKCAYIEKLERTLLNSQQYAKALEGVLIYKIG